MDFVYLSGTSLLELSKGTPSRPSNGRDVGEPQSKPTEMKIGHGSRPKSVGPQLKPSTNPTTTGSEMGGEFTYPKMGSHWC